MSAPNLSLFRIETELLDLMRLREDIASDPDITPKEQQASLAAIDQQITEYVTREVQKVDGIANYLRECEARAAALKTEAERIRERAKAWEQRGERLRDTTLRVMQMIGATELDGATSTFKVRKNPASVEVAQPELVPEPYQRVKITMTRHVWGRILNGLTSLKDSTVLADALQAAVGEPEPMRTEIKQELKAGVGVPGCRLVEDKVRLEVK